MKRRSRAWAGRVFLLSLFFLLFTGCAHFTPRYLLVGKYEQARILYENGLLVEAREKALSVSEKDPEYKEALALVKRIDSLAPEISRDHMELAEDYEKAGLIKKAAEEYEKALRLNPSNRWVKKKLTALRALLEKGVTFVERKKPAAPGKEAAKKGTKGGARPVKKDPEEVAALHYLRGKLYLEIGLYGQAVSELKAALASVRDYKDAPELLKKAQRERLWAVNFHFKKGLEYFKKDELDLAIKEWDMVLALDPGNSEAADYRKRALAIKEKVEKIKKRQSAPPAPRTPR